MNFGEKMLAWLLYTGSGVFVVELFYGFSGIAVKTKLLPVMMAFALIPVALVSKMVGEVKRNRNI